MAAPFILVTLALKEFGKLVEAAKSQNEWDPINESFIICFRLIFLIVDSILEAKDLTKAEEQLALID